MKKTLLLMIFALVLGMLPGKAYTPLVRGGVEWGYVYCDQEAKGAVEFFRLQFHGTVVIDGQEYMKLYIHQRNRLCNATLSYAHMIAVMREENKKVYIREVHKEYVNYYTYTYSYSPERLLYDFEAQVGDKMFESESTNGVCTRIEEENVGDTKRLKYEIDDDFFIMEGIGPMECYPMGVISVEGVATCCPNKNMPVYLLYEREAVDVGNNFAPVPDGLIYSTKYFDHFGEFDPAIWINELKYENPE